MHGSGVRATLNTCIGREEEKFIFTLHTHQQLNIRHCAPSSHLDGPRKRFNWILPGTGALCFDFCPFCTAPFLAGAVPAFFPPLFPCFCAEE